MKSNHDSETIINGYEQANRDAEEMLLYLKNIKDPSQLEEKDLPSLIHNLENANSSVSQAYIGTASIVGGVVASAVGASLASSAFTGGLGMGALIGIEERGVGFATIPVIAAINLLSDAKIKRYIMNNKGTLRKNKSEMNKEKNKLLKWLKELQERGAKLEKEIIEKMHEKYADFKDKAKKLAKDVSIQIDDCMNADINMRILRYNEVILNQYRLQKELEDKVEFLFDEYNKLLKEKKELERQVACLIKLLNAMGCPEALINQALN